VSLNASTIQRLNFVSTQLRVPELKYAALEEPECRELTRRFLQYIHDHPEVSSKSLADVRDTYFTNQRYSVRSTNLMFVVDRCFDVWLRKSGLDEMLQTRLFTWRSQIFSICYFERESPQSLDGITALLDAMGKTLQAWCQNPERAKKQVPQLLDDTLAALCGSLTQEAIKGSTTRWQNYWDDASLRQQKITQRLLEAESDSVAKVFCNAFVQSYLNKMFGSRPVSDTVQSFLHNEWFSLVSQALIESTDASVPESIALLGKKIRAVYCDKGKAAFHYGETLVEELVEQFESYQVSVSEDIWQRLADEVIAILKAQPAQERTYRLLTDHSELGSFELVKPKGYTEGDWLVCEHTGVRSRVLKVFDQYAQALLVNHLGMKLELLTVAELNARMLERKMKKVLVPADFSRVLTTTLNGLEKVAKTQSLAREKAANKALNEAAKLREEQEEAARQVQEKAEEIARRTKEIVDRKEEAQRFDKEQKALELASGLSLGAWVSLEKEDGKQRFKLAVKFAARKRYVFVDKYGIKKLEYNEPELIADIVSNRLVILSDGADFDDSLERVIGRIRMSG